VVNLFLGLELIILLRISLTPFEKCLGYSKLAWTIFSKRVATFASSKGKSIFDSIKRRIKISITSSHHEIQNDTARPDISKMAIISNVLDDFWGQVIDGSASGMKNICKVSFVSMERRQAEIRDFDISLFIKKDIFRFKISMTNILRSAIIQSSDYLSKYSPCMIFI